MASVAFDLFLPEVLPDCPGVSDAMAINAIRNACYDFCRDSLLWSETQTPVSYTVGDPSYVLTAPAGAQVLTVITVTLDDERVVYPAALEDTVAARPGWATDSGTIDFFVQPVPNTIWFVATPDTAGTFTPTVAYAPTRTATSIDSRLYDQHLETIKYGALWKLHQSFQQPWSNPAAAAYFERVFWMGVGAATIERNRGSSRAAMRVAPRPLV